MTEQTTVMVLQLAKELGMPPLALVDKLKALNINVKSHMSELTQEEASLARSTLMAPAEPAKPARKTATKAAIKTSATATAKAGATAAGTPTTATKPAATRAKKKTTTEAAAAAPASEAAPADKSGEKAAAPSPIIRRRTKADGITETVTQNMPAPATPESGEEGVEMTAEQYEALQAETGAPLSEMEEAQGAAPEAEQPQAASAAGTGASEGAAPQAPTKQPIAPFNRPVAPVRKSVLKIVEASAPPPRPMIKPATPAGKPGIKPAGTPGAAGEKPGEGFRIIKMTKENLDQMAEEEAAKKRGGGKEAEIRPEDVRFADYRKKEMVFLPKKKKIPLGKEIKRTEITEMAAHKRVVQMEDTITVAELANAMSVKGVDVVRKLMGMGQMASMNQAIDFDTATLVAGEFQYEVRNVAFKEEDLLAASQAQDQPEQLQGRPPVVTIMGHVDHGKTTLLDSIREANVAAGEAGGITQHIGAYTVEKNGKLITFIDTPGHEAFTVMRARGANVTDIVILVVSADDGVMPQTREALSHAQAAKVPIIVAVNKIDKPGANPEKIKQGLAELNLLAEDWGGETMFVPVSALKKTNLDKLLDSVLLQAEVLDLKANPDAPASGTVLEARLEKGRGPVVSVLVRRGTLKVGDAIVSGPFAGKIRALTDDKGRTLKEVTPGMAGEIQGFEGVPGAGEVFNVAETEAEARTIAQARIDKNRAKAAAPSGKASLDALFAKIQAGEAKSLDVILKADVFGSVEAIRDSLTKLSTEKVKVNVIHAAPGGITESDVLLATASDAIIIGFNVRPETKARQVAEAEHVDIKCYSIIYELIDEIKKAMTGLLDKKKVEKFLGRAEVRQTFSVPKIGTIAGSAVIDGKILRGANVRLLRDSRVIFEGKMSSLKRFKDDAKEVATGYECGIGIENYNDVKAGDIIEAYQIELVTPELTG